MLVGGDGPDRERLESLAKKLQIEKNVLFKGFLRGQAWLEAFQSADVFITASKSENMPLTILEAMSTGLPVVAVGEKGVAEIVRSGENGFLSTADNVEDLARNVLKIKNSEELREKFSLESRKLALDYSYEKVGQNLAHLYKTLIYKSE